MIYFRFGFPSLGYIKSNQPTDISKFRHLPSKSIPVSNFAMWSSPFLRVIALLFSISANATPTPTSTDDHLPKLEDRDIDCNGGNGAVYDNSCWNTLNMTSWLQNWNATTSRCNNSGDGSNCCGPSNNPNEPWSTCFLRLALSNSDYDCSQINLKSCSLEGFVLASKWNASDDMPRYRYAVRNIYGESTFIKSWGTRRKADMRPEAMNNFFNSWFAATQFATTQANLVIAPIISEIDPEKQTNVVLSDILTAFTVGLALLGLPEVSAALEATVSATTALVAHVVSTAIQQAPGVAKAIWPAGSVNSQIVQIGNLQSALGSVNDDLSNRINAGLQAIMSDVPSFLGFASNGSFSGSNTLSLETQTQDLDIGFKTYLLTTAMSQNSWRGSWTNLELSTPPPYSNGAVTIGPPNTTQSSQSSFFGCDFQSNGICLGNGKVSTHPKSWAEWPSPQTNRAWVMDQCCHKNTPTSADLTQMILKNGWGNLGTIFDGGYNCTAAAGSRSNGGKPVVSISDKGVLDMSCVSQLPIIYGCNQPCPVPPSNGGKCAFVVWDGC